MNMAAYKQNRDCMSCDRECSCLKAAWHFTSRWCCCWSVLPHWEAAISSGTYNLWPVLFCTWLADVCKVVDCTCDVNDMENISSSESHEFNKGHFVLKKTARPFSKIALDHAHKQNAKVKVRVVLSDSDSPSSLRWWMVSNPEATFLSRMWDKPGKK